jgi:HEAT repeat protein
MVRTVKRRRIFWVAMGLVALVAALPPAYYLWARMRGEHFFFARPTSYWRGQIHQWVGRAWSPPAPERVLFAFGLQKDIGQPAILGGSPSALPVLLDLVRDEDVTTSELAIHAIGDLGSAASAAIPAIEEAARDPGERLRSSTCRALVNIDPDEAVRFFLQEMKARDDRFLTYLKALGWCGASARRALAEVRPLLQDADARVRSAAAESLGGIGPDAAEALPQLIALLQDREASVRTSASLALSYLGSAAAPAVPALIESLRDPAVSVRRTTARGLGSITPSAEPALQRRAARALVASLRDPDAYVRQSCVWSLGVVQDLGPDTQQVVGKLIEMMHDPEALVHAASYDSLGRFGARAREAVPALVKVWTDHQDAMGVLVSLGPKKKEIGEKALQELVVAIHVARALEQITGLRPMEPPFVDPAQRQRATQAWREWYERK